MSRFCTLSLWIALATLFWGCTADDLTEIVVVVDSDLETPGELSRVTIDVEGLGAQEPVVTNLSERPLPIWLGLVNEGDKLGPITVRVTGFDGGVPVVVAARTNVSFQRGKTLMLRIELLRECVGNNGACAQTCDADDTCLTAWTGPPIKIDASASDAGYDASEIDAGEDDAGVEDAAVDASDASDAASDASDAMIDAGPIDPCTVGDAVCFDYTPSNFDPTTLGAALSSNGALTIDCADAVFDSTTLTLTGSCAVPLQVAEFTQASDVPAVVIPVTSLTIEGGSALRLIGNRPVIFAVFGEATINGTLHANAVRGVPGAGGNVSCSVGNGTGGNGQDQTSGNRGGGGGGGGAFGSTGASGGVGGWATLAGVAGALEGDATLMPLRGGCSGGRGGFGTSTDGGNRGGAGGGAFQVSAAGRLNVGGVLAAGGGGGEKGMLPQDGAGGGGSGGAVLLEGAQLQVSDGAWISTNGGGGGGGYDRDNDSNQAQPGSDAPLTSAIGGAGGARDSNGGAGGTGSGVNTAATAGGDGDEITTFPALQQLGSGGGGGGGGVGRVRIRDNSRPSATCSLPGNYSPLPVIECGGV